MRLYVREEAKRLTDKQCQLETDTVSRPHSHLHYSVACRVPAVTARPLTNIYYHRHALTSLQEKNPQSPRGSAVYYLFVNPHFDGSRLPQQQNKQV